MLRLRLLLGFSIAFSILGLCFLDIYLENLTNIPGIALFPLLILLIYLGVREMLHLANRNHVFPVPYVTYLGCGLIAVSAWATFVFQHTSSSEELSPVPVSVSGASASVPAAVPAAGGGPESVSVPVGPAAEGVKNSAGTAGLADTVSAVSTVGDGAAAEHEIRHRTNRKLLEKLEHLTPGNWALSTFALSVIFVFLQEMWTFVRPGAAVNIRISYTVFTIVYVGLLLTYIAQIRLCHGLPMLAAFIAIVKMGDVGAFTVGKLFGRNKMAPTLSPGKTIEGAFGAILFSVLTALTFFYSILPLIGIDAAPEKVVWWVVYGVVLCLLGMLGDLAESLLKRDAEIKDAGSLVPGFGGVLDILDSLLIAAPVAYAFLTLDLLY
ncbi:MAG: hypothetical protein E7029_13105 [Planctomycetaceae bacterium]|nr:hypothetical protein [Planctomycetaceae bacterium]